MGPDPAYDLLVADLRTLGRAALVPATDSRLSQAVLTRVAELPTPVPASWLRLLADRVLTVLSRYRRVLARLVLVVIVVLLTAPVQAAVSDWFGFAGVKVLRDDPSPEKSRTPDSRDVAGTLTLDDARRLVSFEPVRFGALGRPDGVEVSADERVVSMSWRGGPDGVLRVDQFDGRLDYAFVKTAPDVVFTSVDGGTALWFPDPHDVAVLQADGTRRTESARLAGQTLIWEYGGATLRLEGDFALPRAVQIAESVRPLR